MSFSNQSSKLYQKDLFSSFKDSQIYVQEPDSDDVIKFDESPCLLSKHKDPNLILEFKKIDDNSINNIKINKNSAESTTKTSNDVLNTFYSRALKLNQKKNEKISLKEFNSIKNETNIIEKNNKLISEADISNISINNKIHSDSNHLFNLLKTMDESKIDESFINIDSLQKTINNLASGETLKLPKKKFRLQNLELKRSITIIGNASSIIEITEGPIFINSEEECKIVFSECNIYFDLIRIKNPEINNAIALEIPSNESKSNKSSNNPNSTPNTHRDNFFSLFKIKSKCYFELRDCFIKSLITQNDIQDICFSLKGIDSSLCLKSCTITNFFSVIESTSFSSFFIEKCYFSDVKNHCINASNSFYFKICENSFNKINKSCINLRFSRENINQNKKILSLIQENEFSNSNSYGIAIFSEKMDKHYDIQLNLNHNKFSSIKKEAIYIKNISLSQLEILLNEIQYCKQDGIILDNCGDFLNDGQILLQQNKINACQGNGISIIDSQTRIENNEISKNQKGGLYIRGKQNDLNLFKNHSIRLLINECKIFDNECFGIGINGILKGPIIISKSYLYENLNGIYIDENNINSQKIDLNLDKKNIKSVSTISFEKCSIFQNKRSGVIIECLLTETFISETIIKDNGYQAVVLANQKDKKLIKFKDLELGRLREYVQGFIGGSWGELYNQKEIKNCKGKKCHIY